MGAITDFDDFVDKCIGGNNGNPQTIFRWISNRRRGAVPASPIVGRTMSMWQYDQAPISGAGADPPSSATNCDNTTQGGLLQTDPGGGRELWLTAFGANPQINDGYFILYDRIFHRGGLVGNSGSGQTVSSAIARNTGGVGNEILLEIYTQIGTTARTVTAAYDDAALGSSQTTIAVDIGATGLREADRLIPLALPSGGTGAANVASVTLSATTGTAGGMALVIAKPLLIIPVGSAEGGFIRSAPLGLRNIDTDACLFLAYVPNATGVNAMINVFNFIQA